MSSRRLPNSLAAFAVLALIAGGVSPAAAQSTALSGPGIEVAEDPGQQVDSSDGELGAEVVGGRRASENYPAVAIEYDSDFTDPPRIRHLNCSGSLIGSVWVLTATHCVTNLPAAAAAAQQPQWWPRDGVGVKAPPVWVPVEERRLYLKVGAIDRSQAERVEIERIVVNPAWRWIPDATEGGADFSLIKLARPVKYTPFPLANYLPKPGSKVKVLGWGRLSNDTAVGAWELQELATRVLPFHRCVDGLITPGDVCTANPQNWRGTCNGDSGGPAIFWDGRRWVQVGVVSRSGAELCGITPDVQTGTAAYLRWAKAVESGRIRIDLPLTVAQGGPVPHPTIPIGTTPLKARGLYDLTAVA
ncbi:hypothetical protein SUDANB95_07992 (plasmid) [Actinosynnema sp. ALI-1.44]